MIEWEAVQQAAREHPAKRALKDTVARVHQPAMVTVVSGWNHDTEALLITLEELKGRGYSVIPLPDLRNHKLQKKPVSY